MVRSAVDKCPAFADEAERTAARLKRFHNHPKYQVCYEIVPLLDWLKGLGSPSDLPIDVLTRASIVALRVTTLMRSGDIQNLTNNVFIQAGGYFLVARDKNNKTVWARIEGLTRDRVLEYVYRHRDTPAPHMFRNQNNPALCIGVPWGNREQAWGAVRHVSQNDGGQTGTLSRRSHGRVRGS